MNEAFYPDATPSDKAFNNPRDIRYVMCRLLFSLQNGSFTNYVKFYDDNKKQARAFREVLFDFAPTDICSTYSSSTKLYEAMSARKDEFSIDEKRNAKQWQGFAEGLYQAARLLQNYKDRKSLVMGVLGTPSSDSYENGRRLVLHFKTVRGLGEALASDFVKEAGLADYAKPDVHIIKVLSGLELMSSKEKPAQFTKMLYKIAKANDNLTLYKLDKIIWLICTGNFYRDNRGNARGEYIKELKEKCFTSNRE
jgi:thermostable 8-oxoguanine DNA glycosylase